MNEEKGGAYTPEDSGVQAGWQEEEGLGLCCPPNSLFQDTLHSILVEGIPTPSRSLSTFCLSADSSSSFIHRLFIPDKDNILYKIEASADWPIGWGPHHDNCTLPEGAPEGGPPQVATEGALEGAPEGPLGEASEVSKENAEDPPEGPPTGGPKGAPKGAPKKGGKDLFAHYIAGKPLASCSVSVLSGPLHAADLLLEISSVSRDPAIRRELALQLSRMRQRLQCGPIQRFLRSVHRRKSGCLRCIQIRNSEKIWMGLQQDTVVIIHRFVCTDVLRRDLTLQYCKEFARAATEGLTMRLSDAVASIEAPDILKGELEEADIKEDELAVFLLLGIFSCDISTATRSLRALSLSEMSN
ncbi:hypothetical protein, conserved [Eimeria maxima]|uniref:Uncharacterized protein n=1 Tax=Eimeria maxima TaxID=5804 RepID=U6M0X1_EIMMA|nr:hypothetical protein, conserved [Eimeria maxima]CDJ57641.1 hypothetical protein, conserved [Eimeria maxima]